MTALLDDLLEESVREVAVPLTSLSDSGMGSRETNSLDSNWTTTYGRACTLRTFRLRAWMSLTWIWPFEGESTEEEVEVEAMVEVEMFLGGGGGCMMKTGA